MTEAVTKNPGSVRAHSQPGARRDAAEEITEGSKVGYRSPKENAWV